MGLLEQFLIDRLGKRDDTYGWRRYKVGLNPLPGEKLCILHLDNKLGDAIINSMLVDGFHRHFPWLEISILTTGQFQDYWSSHPHVSEAIAIHDSKRRGLEGRIFSEMATAKRLQGKFDYAVFFSAFAKFEEFLLLKLLEAKTTIGFNKYAYALFDVSLVDCTFDVERSHTAKRLLLVLRQFGIEESLESLSAHMPITPDDLEDVSKRLGLVGKQTPTVLINPYGAANSRCLSWENTLRVIDSVFTAAPDSTIVLNMPENALSHGYREHHLERYCGRVQALKPFQNYKQLFALVSLTDLTISTDTAIGHIAAALRKPTFSLFHEPRSCPSVWRPLAPFTEISVALDGDDVNGQDWVDTCHKIEGFARKVLGGRSGPCSAAIAESIDSVL